MILSSSLLIYYFFGVVITFIGLVILGCFGIGFDLTGKWEGLLNGYFFQVVYRSFIWFFTIPLIFFNLLIEYKEYKSNSKKEKGSEKDA